LKVVCCGFVFNNKRSATLRPQHWQFRSFSTTRSASRSSIEGIYSIFFSDSSCFPGPLKLRLNNIFSSDILRAAGDGYRHRREFEQLLVAAGFLNLWRRLLATGATCWFCSVCIWPTTELTSLNAIYCFGDNSTLLALQQFWVKHLSGSILNNCLLHKSHPLLTKLQFQLPL
jgi:hypothetical protein